MTLDLRTRETLIASLPHDGWVAEIGVDYGVFSEKILELNKPKWLWLVDCWTNQDASVYGHDPANNEDSFKMGQYEQVKEKFDGKRVTVVRGYSNEAAQMFKDSSLDWIHIDANHLQARQDIEAWWDKVKSGGWIMGHDYTMVGDYITVKKDVDEFVKERGLELFVTTGEGGDIYEKNYPTWCFKKP